jgi:hypothetical protein
MSLSLTPNAYGGNVPEASKKLWVPGKRRLDIAHPDVIAEPIVEHFPPLTMGTQSTVLADCPEKFPTKTRAALYAGLSNPLGRFDFRARLLAVPGYSGTGQTSIGGEKGGVAATSAVREGHSDVRMVSIEDSGRSTGEYEMFQDLLAQVFGFDQVTDSDRTTTAHIHSGLIDVQKGDCVVIDCHSAGVVKGLGVAEAILRETDADIHAFVNQMGVPTDQTWRLARSGKFLLNALPHTPKALWQVLTQRGAMDLMNDPDAYARAMFGLKKATPETDEHRKFAVVDSALAFLSSTFHSKTKHLAGLVDKYGDRIKNATIVTVVAGQENLLPDATQAQSKTYKELGMRERKVIVPTTHSIPRHLNPSQSQGFSNAFSYAFDLAL